jgi:hypothetical protein
MSDLAPIVLFVYNRPEHTRRTLAALAANPLAVESDLIIYADGPKRPEHAAAINKARDVARGASGFKSVTIVERDRNLGLANSIILGVSEVCSERGRVIVLEDDLLVAPQFLTFLNRGLERYVNEQNLFQVSGYMFPVETEGIPDGLFLPLISCWGWATWHRAWTQFDPSALGYDQLKRDPELRARFNLDDCYDYFGMLTDQIEGKIDSWGVRWLLSVFLKGGLVLYPQYSLVRNIGVDGTGTHGAGTANLQGDLRVDAYATCNYQNLPSELRLDAEVLHRVKGMLSSPAPHPLVRLIRRFFR